MKRSITLVVLSLGFLFLTTNSIVAQSENLGGGARPSQEQSLKELVNEVRQLRAMLERVNTTVHRTNIVVERFKVQQELVARAGRELDDVREKLADTRVEILKLKEVVKRFEMDVEVGAGRSQAELATVKLELDNSVQRELRLVQRETQLTNDLSLERLKLLELNDKLSKLELELNPR